MTVDINTGGEVATWTEEELAAVGMEDVKPSDLALPRLTIVGKRAVFKNSLTEEEFTELDAVMLGQVKHRVMWPEKTDAGDYKQPMCKSTDFEHGFPNVDPKAPARRAFPWAQANFQEEAGREGAYNRGLMVETGLPSLPCQKCVFQTWVDGSTRCKEQHVFPLYYKDSADEWVPALLTVQGAGIKPSKNYVNSFFLRKRPMFSVVTHITLTPLSRDSVDYAVPVFKAGNPTEPGSFAQYADMMRSTRDFLRRPPMKRDEETVEQVPTSNVNAPADVVVPPPAQEVVPPPVQQPVAPPAAPAPAPVAPPVAPPVQVAPPAPVAQVTVPEVAAQPPTSPPAAPAPAAPATAGGDSDDDLPF